MKQTEVAFNWRGEEYTASGTADYETSHEDVGPCRQGEHSMAEVVDAVEMFDVEILRDGELVVDPVKELLDKANDLLCVKAEDDFYDC
jgi:hypothetical protein